VMALRTSATDGGSVPTLTSGEACDATATSSGHAIAGGKLTKRDT